VLTTRELFAPGALILALEHSSVIDQTGMTALSNLADAVAAQTDFPVLLTGLGAAALRGLERARDAHEHWAMTWNLAPVIGGISPASHPSLLYFRSIAEALDYCADKLVAKPLGGSTLALSDEAVALMDRARLTQWRANDSSPETEPNTCRLPSFARSTFIDVIVEERYAVER